MYKFACDSPFYFEYLTKLSLKQLWRHAKGHLLYILKFPVLRAIFICASHECNANCRHCYEKFIHEKFLQSLSTEQIKNIIDQFYDMGGYLVFFCSGELLLRSDAMELISYARSKNLAISLTTNGLLLDEEKVKELKKAGLTVMFVSLDSADAQTHDNLRGVKGCFEKAVNGIKLAQAAGIPTGIWTYASKNHSDELEGIAKLAYDLKAKNVFVYLPLLGGNFWNKQEENFTAEERNALRKRFKYTPNLVLEFSSEDDLCTGGGLYHICVMPTGDVTFCPPVPYSYGNIRTKSIKECLKEIKKDYKRFCLGNCKGQCPVNFDEYKNNCNAKFIYE